MKTKTYQEKIRQIMAEKNWTQKDLAEELCISVRTLSDIYNGGRDEPPGPVAKLINLLAGEEFLEKRNARNFLIFMHRDYLRNFPEDKSTRRSSTPENILKKIRGQLLATVQEEGSFVVAESHFVSATTDEFTTSIIIDGLRSQNIRGHFIDLLSDSDPTSTLDCFFSVTVIAESILKSIEKKVDEIILLCDPERFWPLALELKKILNTQISFESFGTSLSETVKGVIKKNGITVLRMETGVRGVVTKKFAGYGYIKPEVPEKPEIFFHRNSIKKGENGRPECSFDDLNIGSIVIYQIGENYMGPCAIDVILVGDNKTEKEFENYIESPFQEIVVSEEEKEKIIPFIDAAIGECADSEGWALLADVGQRIIMNPKFSKLKKEDRKWNVVMKNHEKYEYKRNGAGTRRAACVRLKK